MPIYDLTVPLTDDMPTYPGDPGIQIRAWYSLANGDPANVTYLNFGAHTGTHVDAPAHFIDGASKVESLALDVLIGKVQVIDVPEKSLSIDANFVKTNFTSGHTRVIFKT